MLKQPSAPHKPIIIGSIFILTLVFLMTFFGGNLFQFFGLIKISSTSMYLSRLLFWLSLCLIALYAVKIEHQKLLLWEEKEYPITFQIVALVLLFLTVFAGVILIQIGFTLAGSNNKSATLAKIVLLLKKDFILLLFTAITAGVVEELIFRGYLQPRLQIIFKNPHVSIFITCALFGMMHYKYGTLINVIGPFFIGLVLAYFYWRYKNIKIAMLFHFLWDFILLIISTNSTHQ